jgi:photosystem II stability/assembly factor-like uncharacterized protein
MKQSPATGIGLAVLALAFVAGPTAPVAAQTIEPLAHETLPAGSGALWNLKFRNLGPANAGGRVSAVVGIPGQPNVYYVGAAAGGVFKTVDGGLTWKPIFANEATASIGAVAVAPSDPDVVWVGTGEANIRNDVIDGRGVYVSDDAGRSWQFKGLRDAGQISQVIVDPANPDDVFVAALGHAWGPNADRGVFRTRDGGRTWTKVLFVNDTTGAADLVMQPGNPRVLFAAMWQARRYPWELVDGGEGSGIYRSTDGGGTWSKLTEGLPPGPLGRIALAIAPSDPDHVYALVEAKRGLLWQSMDLGKTWTAVSDNHQLDVRPFYFSKLVVAPNDERKVYFLSFQLVESDDGGRTARHIDRGVHPDHHALWIDPKNPDRMIQGNDGGVYLTTDAGKSWRYLDNLPIEQFYMVAADGRTPYDLCGGLQDNNAWCGPSNSLSPAGITARDWWVATGGDGEYAVPAPSDPNIVYADSQNGSIVRVDRRTHLAHFVRPYLHGVEDTALAQLQYRFNWTSPIAVSPTNADDVYLGGNVVFHSTDGGRHWAAISGDLTRNDKTKQVQSGGPIEKDLSGAETYDTILSMTLAPTAPNVLWVGTDDGLVQLTRDGGKTWTNVTPAIPGAPQWARVYQIGVSAFDPGTAYVAFDAHMLDDHRPYAYATTDYGRTWRAIARGLPADGSVYVVREDPNRRGLLVAGTEVGLFYSPDAGATWLPLKMNMPTVPVFDVQFAKASHDLLVATHGRGLFVLDDIRPLEEWTRSVETTNVHLFAPAPGTIVHLWSPAGFAQGGFSAPNPPDGVVIDYFLKHAIAVSDQQKRLRETPVKIVVTDDRDRPVATLYGPSKAGVNRFVWNMRYDPPEKLAFEKAPEEGMAGPFGGPRGPLVTDGSYHVALTVSGQTERATVPVQYAASLAPEAQAMRAQTQAALQLRDEVTTVNRMLNRLDGLEKEVHSFQQAVRTDGEERSQSYDPLMRQARAVEAKVKALRDTIYDPNVQHEVPEDDIHDLARFHGELDGLYRGLLYQIAAAPNGLVQAEMATLRGELEQDVTRFNALLKTDVAEYNKAAFEKGAPTLFAGRPIVLATGAAVTAPE